MQKFNKKINPTFLGLAMSMVFSINSLANTEGWRSENGTWKYYKDGGFLSSWQQINNKWYYFNTDGSLKTGWFLDSKGNWYFLDSSLNSNQGVLLSGWQWINGYCYYFEPDSENVFGRMYANTSVDGYKLSPLGRWIDESEKEHYEPGKGISSGIENTNTEKRTSKGAAAGKSSGGGTSLGKSGNSSGGNSGNNNTSGDNLRRISEGTPAESDKSTQDASSNKPNSNHNNTPENSTDNTVSNNDLTSGNVSDNPGGIDNDVNKVPENSGEKREGLQTETLAPSVNPGENKTDQNNFDYPKTNGTDNFKQNNGNITNPVSPDVHNKKSDNTKTDENNTLNNNITQPATSSNAQTTENGQSENSQANQSQGTTSEHSTVPNKPSENNLGSQIQESDEDKAEKVKNSLITEKNNNVVQYTNEEGEIRTIIWAKGISAPVMGENGDFQKEITPAGTDIYVDYKAPYVLGNYWYDSNKNKAGGNTLVDRNLCFGATSANMLYWWLDGNSDYIDSYITKEGDIRRSNRNLSDLRTSFNSQQDSGIFNLFKVLFGNNDKGFYSDLLLDLFINGYTPKQSGGTNIEKSDLTPDQRGGFFYNVFKGTKLTERTYGGNYNDLSDKLKEILGNEGIVGLSHKTFTNSNHIVTLWGAEYDLKGKLTAVYITDSDDQNEEPDERDLGMKRFEVRNVGGVAKVSTNQSNKSAGSEIGYLHVLYLGSEIWEDYLSQ